GTDADSEDVIFSGHLHDQYAPRPVITTNGVANRIFKSSIRDQFWMYSRSNWIISSNGRSLRPRTCQSPVSPGLTSERNSAHVGCCRLMPSGSRSSAGKG